MKQPPDHTKSEEAALLSAYFKGGDITLLGKLYEPYMYMVLGVCLKYLKDAQQAQDAVMQIFEELVGKLRQHQVENFRSWLYTYSRNFCLMELRKKNKLVKVELSDAVLMENTALVHLFKKEDDQEAQLQSMEACIQALKDNQKRCVELFFFKNKCYKEIADDTGYTLNQVKSHIQNGKRNIRICMEKKDEQ